MGLALKGLGCGEPIFGGEFDGPVYRLPIRVYFEDTDLTGVVYHANYVRYCERARTDFLRTIGISHSDLALRDLAFAVTNLSLSYKSPAKIDDLIHVACHYRGNKGAVMIIDQLITRRDQEIDTLLCTAKIEVVMIDPNGRPKRIPKDIIDAFRPYVQTI
jgi:acyl-CoA thioester hydrolase